MNPFSTIKKVVFFAIIFIAIYSQNIFAQTVIEVEPEFGALNAAINDNPGAIFELQRDGHYILDAAIANVEGAPITIRAAEGEGKKPVIIPGTADGDALLAFDLNGDMHIQGVYISNINELGEKAGKNMIFANAAGMRLSIDDCIIDGDRQAPIRMQQDSSKLIVTNSMIGNASSTDDPWDGLSIVMRGLYQDSLVFINTTFYINSYRTLQHFSVIPNTMVFDHCTIYQTGGTGRGGASIDFRHVINGKFTNNLIMDYGIEGIHTEYWKDAFDSTAVTEIIQVEALPAESEVATDDERSILISNNVYGWSPEVKAYQEARGILPSVFIGDTTMAFLNQYDNMVVENNIEEYVPFTDGPDIQVFLDYAIDRFDKKIYDGMLSIVQDRNGAASYYDTDGPATFGEADNPFDFAYSVDSDAYKAAENLFPAGDLNWFPEQYDAWKNGDDPVGVAENEQLPSVFSLSQNYPNPFNPSTTIEYSLPNESEVTLEVFDILGSKVASLINSKNQQAGNYSVKFDASQLSSGIYFYKITSKNIVLSKKMLLLK